MKRAVPILLLTIAGLVPLWRFEAEPETVVAAPEAPAAAAPDTAAPDVSGTSQAPAASGAQTVTGSLISTKYGDVQVRLTYAGDQITAVTMVKQPNSGPTKMAVPVLVRETLDAQSADVDTVSGATTTSGAYVQSLQAAIDAKGD